MLGKDPEAQGLNSLQNSHLLRLHAGIILLVIRGGSEDVSLAAALPPPPTLDTHHMVVNAELAKLALYTHLYLCLHASENLSTGVEPGPCSLFCGERNQRICLDHIEEDPKPKSRLPGNQWSPAGAHARLTDKCNNSPDVLGRTSSSDMLSPPTGEWPLHLETVGRYSIMYLVKTLSLTLLLNSPVAYH